MSKAAHRSRSDQQREGDRRTILEEYDLVGDAGLTCDEVEDRLNFSHQTASARLTELKRDGELRIRIVDGIGQRRKTRTGRTAWVLIRVK
jgi:DNA-binding transcriptional regulator LsrR (DeoR family)